MGIKTILSAVVAGSLVASTAFGAVPAPASASAVLAKMRSHYPEVTFQSAHQSEIRGLYEVKTDDATVYVDQEARYGVFGKLIDLVTGQSPSEQREVQQRKSMLLAADLSHAIKVVHGNGARTLYLFSDPDCPYCHRLEESLAKVENVTIYTFVYPLTQLHPQAVEHATQIWCSPDRVKAWDQWMSGTPLGAAPACATPIEANLQFGAKLGIRGTPTLLTADGRQLSGFSTPERIEAFLKAPAAATQADR